MSRTGLGTLFLRSLLVQGSFDFKSLIGGGFGWILIPELRRIHPDKVESALRRHCAPFNSHPYLVGIAVGAVIRMEEQGMAPEVITRFKDAVQGSLGSLGDRLFWASLRPTLLLVALAVLVLGVQPWLVASGFLILYNLIQVGLRWWGLRIGLAEGSAVAKRLQDADLGLWSDRLGRVGAVAIGILYGVLITRFVGWSLGGGVWIVFTVAAFGIGSQWGTRVVRPARWVFAGVLLMIALTGL